MKLLITQAGFYLRVEPRRSSTAPLEFKISATRSNLDLLDQHIVMSLPHSDTI